MIAGMLPAASLRVLDQPARLRRQDLGDVRGGQVAMPAVAADRTVLQPHCRPSPRPFDVARHVVERAQHALQEGPQLRRAPGRAVGNVPRCHGSPSRDRVARCGLACPSASVSRWPSTHSTSTARCRTNAMPDSTGVMKRCDRFLEAAIEQLRHARGRLRCRYAQERRMQAGVGRIGWSSPWLDERIAHSASGWLAKAGQARIVGVGQRQRGRHGRPAIVASARRPPLVCATKPASPASSQCTNAAGASIHGCVPSRPAA